VPVVAVTGGPESMEMEAEPEAVPA
jgi:hypothetical protein